MRRVPPIALLVALAAGCGSAGPEVRIAADPAEWRPARVVVLPPTLAAGAIQTGRALPAGLAAPTADQATARVREAVVASLAGCAPEITVEPAAAFSRSAAGEAAARLARQYQDARQADPAAGRDAAGEWDDGGGAGLLAVTILRYGPEVDEDVQSMSKSVSTTVGTTDVGISSSTQRIVAWLTVHVRCALIRGSDGAMTWDVAARRRVRSAAAGEAGLAGVLAQVTGDLCLGWPWRPKPAAAGEPAEASLPAAPAEPAAATPAAVEPPPSAPAR